MSGLFDWLRGLPAELAYVVVGLLVFAEDALFVGFVIPGETAAVIGGVIASQDHVPVLGMIAVVVGCAILGDSVGYEVGKHAGPKLLSWHRLDAHRRRLDEAQDFLARRGGVAVFLGRFVAFFRAVMPALAGASHMPYRTFLPWNALGGAIWGTGFVLLGFVAGNSYEVVAREVGRDAALVVVGIVLLALLVWVVRRRRATRAPESTDS